MTQQVARELLASGNYSRLGFLPMGKATAPLWDLHNGNVPVDCSHYCYTPQLAELLAFMILEHLPE
jgi:hypothetical protein